ncbi:MAG: stage II sporulation protein P [Clostridia bacterium]|nr:stage II sporulation protein P [Clostridia bacterium]
MNAPLPPDVLAPEEPGPAIPDMPNMLVDPMPAPDTAEPEISAPDTSVPELLPSPPEDAEFRSRAQRIRDAFAWLRAAIPILLAGFAAAVFTGTAILLVLRLDPTPDHLTRMLLSSSTGGAEIRAAERDPGPMTAAIPRLSPDGSIPRTASLPGPADPPGTEPEQTEQTPEPESAADDPAPPAEPDPGTSADPAFPLTNETAYTPDTAALLTRSRAIPPLADLLAMYGEDAPAVLILHTHTTEGYAESADSDYRTHDPAEGVIAAGDVLARTLEEAGIPVLHLTTVFDEPDFNLSYYNAARAIRTALAEHPSIRYIFDVHRDSIALPDGSAGAVCTEIGGEAAGQLMFVVGTDAAGADHPGWEDNLALALRLQRAAREAAPGLMRDINLRAASFNEQYAPGALLIEAASTGCTAEEACRGMAALASVITEEIKGVVRE